MASCFIEMNRSYGMFSWKSAEQSKQELCHKARLWLKCPSLIAFSELLKAPQLNLRGQTARHTQKQMTIFVPMSPSVCAISWNNPPLPQQIKAGKRNDWHSVIIEEQCPGGITATKGRQIEPSFTWGDNKYYHLSPWQVTINMNQSHQHFNISCFTT